MLKIVHEKEQANKQNKNTAAANNHFSMQNCDEGMSPMLQKLPRAKK